MQALDEGIERPTAPADSNAHRYYRPELDVVRFLAFLLVFAHHEIPESPDPRVAPILKGFAPILYSTSNACGFGLCLFFALSAFLICELLIRERSSTGTVAVKQFYIRRILRIWPLYYLGVAIGLLVALLPASHRGGVLMMGWFSIFIGGWYTVFHGQVQNPMGPLWSISVEEQFYLLAPWIVKRLNTLSLYGFCATILLVANTWLFYLGSRNASDNATWFNSFVQFECFAAGILLCLFLRGRLPRLALWYRIALLVCSWSCWFFACFALNVRMAQPGPPGSWNLIAGYGLAAFGCVLFLIAFLGMSAKLLPRWAIYLGRISFGLYVYHGLAAYMTSNLLIGHLATFKSPIYLLKGAITLGLTISMAALSYRYFETPFLKMKRRHAVIESQPPA
jgi:peptidoglycan/LPS O-acetylase OafA/YrhL